MEKKDISRNKLVEEVLNHESIKVITSENWRSFYQGNQFLKENCSIDLILLCLVLEDQMQGLGAYSSSLENCLPCDSRKVKRIIDNLLDEKERPSYLMKYNSCPSCGTEHYFIPVVCTSEGCFRVLRRENGSDNPNYFPKFLYRTTKAGRKHIKGWINDMGQLLGLIRSSILHLGLNKEE